MDQEVKSLATPFKFQSRPLRVVADDQGNPWFCAKDVCDILGYANDSKAVGDHCKPDGVTNRYPIADALGREQFPSFLSEGNLYRLIIKSNKPEAEPFESWVCDEVLPTIRKTGSYGNSEEVVFQGLMDQVDELKQELAETLALAGGLVEKNSGLIRAFRERMAKAMKAEMVSAEKDLAKELRAIVKKCGSDNPKAIKEAAHALVDKNPERYQKSHSHPYAFIDSRAIERMYNQEFSDAVRPAAAAATPLRAKLAPGGSIKAIGHMGGAA